MKHNTNENESSQNGVKVVDDVKSGSFVMRSQVRVSSLGSRPTGHDETQAPSNKNVSPSHCAHSPATSHRSQLATAQDTVVVVEVVEVVEVVVVEVVVVEVVVVEVDSCVPTWLVDVTATADAVVVATVLPVVLGDDSVKKRAVVDDV